MGRIGWKTRSSLDEGVKLLKNVRDHLRTVKVFLATAVLATVETCGNDWQTTEWRRVTLNRLGEGKKTDPNYSICSISQLPGVPLDSQSIDICDNLCSCWHDFWKIHPQFLRSVQPGLTYSNHHIVKHQKSGFFITYWGGPLWRLNNSRATCE